MMMTQRCKIRRLSPDDLDDFMVYRNDMEWIKYTLFKGLTREEYQAALVQSVFPEDGLQLAVLERESDQLIGDLYIKRQLPAFWIGYTIHPAYAKRGMMREAVSHVLDMLLNCPGCVEVFAGTLPENSRSKNLLEKIGFRFAYYDEAEGEDVYRFTKEDGIKK